MYDVEVAFVNLGVEWMRRKKEIVEYGVHCHEHEYIYICLIKLLWFGWFEQTHHMRHSLLHDLNILVRIDRLLIEWHSCLDVLTNHWNIGHHTAAAAAVTITTTVFGYSSCSSVGGNLAGVVGQIQRRWRATQTAAAVVVIDSRRCRCNSSGGAVVVNSAVVHCTVYAAVDRTAGRTRQKIWTIIATVYKKNTKFTIYNNTK